MNWENETNIPYEELLNLASTYTAALIACAKQLDEDSYGQNFHTLSENTQATSK